MTTLRAKDNFASGTIVPVTGVRKRCRSRVAQKLPVRAAASDRMRFLWNIRLKLRLGPQISKGGSDGY
jgi:hypothetical protein